MDNDTQINKTKKGNPAWIKGYHHSEETKMKISMGNKGRAFHNSKEYRKKISLANKGRHHLNKTKQKLSGREDHLEQFKKKIEEKPICGYDVVVNGLSFKSVKAAARHFGINYSTFIYNIHKYGSLCKYNLQLNYISETIIARNWHSEPFNKR